MHRSLMYLLCFAYDISAPANSLLRFLCLRLQRSQATSSKDIEFICKLLNCRKLWSEARSAVPALHWELELHQPPEKQVLSANAACQLSVAGGSGERQAVASCPALPAGTANTCSY